MALYKTIREQVPFSVGIEEDMVTLSFGKETDEAGTHKLFLTPDTALYLGAKLWQMSRVLKPKEEN